MHTSPALSVRVGSGNNLFAVRLLGLIATFTVPVAAEAAEKSLRLEAEAAQLTGVEIAVDAADGTPQGHVLGFDEKGDRVTWNFTPPAGAGFYRITLGVRSLGGHKEYAGGVDTPNLGAIGLSGRVPAVAEFTALDAGLVELAGGACSLWIGGGWGHYEIDYAELTAVPALGRPAALSGVPCDPEATPATRALLARLAKDYGRVTLSGQHQVEGLAWVEQHAGRTPTVLSGDLVEYSPSRLEHGSDPKEHTEKLIARHGQGHLISLLWHWNAPANLLLTQEQPWWSGFYTRASTFDAAAALADPAGENYGRILRDIDAIAVELKKFAAADIPVLWRPLHEAEGGWFWWGARGPETYKKLWLLLHERLTKHHGLHNLIWVLTSEDPKWYPGDDYVDVIGVDAYPQDPNDLLSARWRELQAHFDGKKLIALTEFGGVPDIPRMQRLGIWWSWFAPWSGDLGPKKSSVERIRAVYSHDAVATLPKVGAGTAK